MRTFAPKPKATQQTTSAKYTIPGRAHFRQSHEANSMLHSLPTIGNQPVQQPIATHTGQVKGDATTTEVARLGHDFSRVSVHAIVRAGIQQKPRFNGPLGNHEQGTNQVGVHHLRALNVTPLQTTRSDGDMRGEAEEDELDQRLDAGVPQPLSDPPDHRMLCRASATGVSLGASGPINDGSKYGLRTPIIVRGTDLGNVLDSELVGTSIDHTGSMATRPSAKSNNSGFMPADSIPDDQHTSGISDHLSYFDAHGGNGSYSRLQMDLYKVPNCNINTPAPIPNSGYRVKRTVQAEGTKVVGIVTKTAEDVTIDGYTTTAGLTPQKEAKVTLR